MVTMHDVAKLAGVSVGTVSNVINGSRNVAPETLSRVNEAIKELNYIPNFIAKSLKTNKSHIIGVISENLDNFFTATIVDGINEFCESKDYAINLGNLRTKVAHASPHLLEEFSRSESFTKKLHTSINSLRFSRISGLIYIGAHARDVSGLLPQLDIPIVYTYAFTKGQEYCVNFDEYQGAVLAVNHLINLGHKKIALICGSCDSDAVKKRTQAFKDSMQSHNIDVNDDYIKEGNWHYDDGYNQCLSLLNMKNPPTAIFAMNDLMAYGVINACLDNGYKIPQDVSIHGFDGLTFSAYTNPPLTTIKLPLADMGRKAAKTIIGIIEGRSPKTDKIILPCSHVVGNTVLNI